MGSTVTVEVPLALAPFVQEVVDHILAFQVSALEGNSAKPPDFRSGEAMLMGLTSQLEAASIGQMLQALDPVAPRVEVGGIVYRRLNQDAMYTYSALRGKVVVNRHLYREEGVRNGPTVVPLDLRAGIVDSRYTAAAAVGLARLAQAMPSREAETTCESLQVLPYSRSEHFRMGVEMGSSWDETRGTAEATLVREMALDDEAVSISLAVDRVSMPMAEPRELTPDDIERGIKNPISVNLRMAFSAVWTLYDAEGRPLQAVRYAHVPTGGATDMAQSLSRDLAVLMERRPGMRIVTLADGAPDMQAILDQVVDKRAVAARLVDYWHVAEKLGKAISATDRYRDDLLGDWKASLLASDAAIDDIHQTLEEWSEEYEPETIPAEESKEHEPETIPAALHDALTYLENNKNRMRYASIHQAGLPIGSGTVEATCKTIVDVRMKRAGCRWVESERGPQAILGLRSLATSDPKRWKAAMPHILTSYKKTVTMLKARVGRAKRQRVATTTT